MRLALLAAAATVALFATAANAATVDVTVDSHAGPWDQGANPTFNFGVGDNTGPASVSSGFNFSGGGTFTITYVSGDTQPFGGTPIFDANGDTGFVTANNSSSGTPFPTDLFSSSSDTFLNELIGTFADASGAIVGTPFAIGNGPFNIAAPGGATQLLLGVNDDIFNDNTGSLLIEVSGPSAAGGVPEPASWALMIGGFALTGAALRRRVSGLVGA